MELVKQSEFVLCKIFFQKQDSRINKLILKCSSKFLSRIIKTHEILNPQMLRIYCIYIYINMFNSVTLLKCTLLKSFLRNYGESTDNLKSYVKL